MSIKDKEQKLKLLFLNWAGTMPESMELLPQSGSNRKYYRMASADKTAIGVIGENSRENEAFLSFSKSLLSAGFNVPTIYGVDEPSGVYIQQDLGTTSLFDLINSERKAHNGAFTPRLKEIYKKVLTQLADIQTKGRNVIDFSKCYPRAAFDAQSIRWDLQYFKYYFLKLAGVAFDEELLEKDFDTFTNYLLETNCKFFLYRDMQSRNIMVDAAGEPWFIDYQGGRRGARQYDVASLLYDAKADIPSAVRNELLAFYVSRLREREGAAFIRHYYGYCLVRIMQAMGAYGYRGYFERKAHFLKSIPFALDNLSEIIRLHMPEIDIPELSRIWRELAANTSLRQLSKGGRLKVTVSSFSYKHGIPVDTSGNGGGFVFDCRALPNPGREERYRQSTGRDDDVVAFFDEHKAEMLPFIESVEALLSISIKKYTERGFENLMVNFGCTGGQHRSVYCAETISLWIKENFATVDVVTNHIEHPERRGVSPTK